MQRLRRIALVLLLCVLAVVLASAASARVFLIDHAGSGDYVTIQEGIDAASHGDTVLVMPGRYHEWLTMYSDKDGVTLMSSEGADSTFIYALGSSAPSLLYVEATGPETRVAGFTFEGNLANSHGGGVRCSSAGLTLEDCVIQDCSAGYRGGGIRLYEPVNVVIRRCVVRRNSALEGGGLYAWKGQVLVEDTEFADNWIIAFNGVDGGGAVLDETEATFLRCTLRENYSISGHGDGLKGQGNSTVWIEECSFQDQEGPAIYVSVGMANITNSVFTGNGDPLSESDAVVITGTASSGLLACTDNVFSGNRTQAFYVYSQLPVLTGNSIDPNGHSVIRFHEDADAGTLDASGNWWGTTDPLEIAALIHDCNDDPAIDSCVDFSDWCNDPSCSGTVTTVPEAEPTTWGAVKGLYR